MNDPLRQVALGLLVLALILLGWHAAARGAQVTPGGIIFTEQECRNFAEFIQQVGDARDAGIGNGEWQAYLRKRMVRTGAPLEARKFLLSQASAAHLSGLDVERLEAEAWTRCISGPMAKPES